MKQSTCHAIRFVGGRYPKRADMDTLRVASSFSSPPLPVCQPQLIYSSHIVFPTHRGGPQRGAISISSTGLVDSIHPSIALSDAKHLANKLNRPLLDLGDDIAVSPGLIDVHCHISELGRNWEGYETATRAAAAGGITTLMGMPLNSLPATTTVDALHQEIDAADKVKMVADVGLWGGAVPSNTSDEDGLQHLKDLLNRGVFGLKAFLAPLPPTAGYETVSPDQLARAAAVCGEFKKPLLVHSELMTQEEQDAKADEAYTDSDDGSYKAHVASRPEEWEQAAVEVVCALANECHMHVVHLSDAGCLDIIERTKLQLGEQRRASREDGIKGNLTVETCPHYLLFDAESLPDGDTRYKCFPPIRSKANQTKLWRRGLLGINNSQLSLIDMIASDHSPCSTDLRLLDHGNVRNAWGGLSGLQYQLHSTATAIHRNSEDNESIENILALMAEWWSVAPARLVPGLSAVKGTIDVGQQADLCTWDPTYMGKPNDYSIEHHRWVNGGVYANMELKGRVVGTWLRGVQVYGGETDTFVGDDDNGVGSFMLSSA